MLRHVSTEMIKNGSAKWFLFLFLRCELL